MVAEIFRYDCSHIMLSLNDDDDDAKALPTGVPKDDAMKKGGWGGQNVSKSDGVILVCSLTIPVQIELNPQSELLLYIGLDYEETPIQSEI